MRFMKNRIGQVSVEWIIIAAVVVAVAVFAMKQIRTNAETKATQIGTDLAK